jgi:hypothetical protein
MIFDMFRASLCSSSGGQLYIYSIWYRPILYAAIQCTDQERTAVSQPGDNSPNLYVGTCDNQIVHKCTHTGLQLGEVKR